MAIRLKGCKLETPASSAYNGARKFFVSCRFLFAPETTNIATYVSMSGAYFLELLGNIGPTKRLSRCRVDLAGWHTGLPQAQLSPNVTYKITLVYDADDPAAQGYYCNGDFYASAAPAAAAIAASGRVVRLNAGPAADCMVEELVMGRGVVPTAAQAAALGELTAATAGMDGVLAELIGAGGSLNRWTLRGESGAPAGGADDPGTTPAGPGALGKFAVVSGEPAYGGDMGPPPPAHFGQPTIMSSGLAVAVQPMLQTPAGEAATHVVSFNPAKRPTFRVNGGPPIAAIADVGADSLYKGALCLLPADTVIAPTDVVTWSAPAGWITTDASPTMEVVDAPCRNRVGACSYDWPAGVSKMRVGLNFDLPGPTYYTQYRIHPNMGRMLSPGGLGTDPANRRGSMRGTFNKPGTFIFDMTEPPLYDPDKIGMPRIYGAYYLAWTDHGARPDNDDLPCNFAITTAGSNPHVKLRDGASRDEVLPDGSVRRVRIYDTYRGRSDTTLAEAISAEATEIALSAPEMTSTGSSNNVVLELPGETIVARGNIKTPAPPRLTDCVRGVKGTAQSHAAGTPAVVTSTLLGGSPTLSLTGTAGKVHYSDLTVLGPDDWDDPGLGGTTPLIYVDDLALSTEFRRTSAEGLGVVRTMRSMLLGNLPVEADSIRYPTDALWSGKITPFGGTFTAVRPFTGGAGEWAYFWYEAPGSQTYPVTLLEPIGAAAAGSRETIQVEGTEANPLIIGGRLLIGDEVLRLVSGSGTSWLVERGQQFTTPAAAPAGEILAGWRLPIAAVVADVDDGSGGDDEGNPGPPPDEEGEGDGGTAGGDIDVPSGPIHGEFVAAVPHGMSSLKMMDASLSAGYKGRPDLNIQARRTGTLTADITAEDLTLHVAFAPEDWPWIAPGLQIVIGGDETMYIDTVDKVAGVVTLLASATPRVNAQPRLAGTPIATRSNRVLCESVNGAHRAWQYFLNYTSGTLVTGPTTVYGNREPKQYRSCVRIVPGQQLDNYGYSEMVPGDAAYPFETSVKAAEESNAWLIVNVCGHATDDFVIAMAKRIRDCSTPGKTTFALELGNEVWNFGFPYYYPYLRWAKLAGNSSIFDFLLPRSWRVFQLFLAVFNETGRGGELVHYVPWQMGGVSLVLDAARRLDIPIHATGCAPYTQTPATPDMLAWINAAVDDGPVCDAYAWAMANYTGRSSVRVGLEKDSAAIAAHRALRPEDNTRLLHYEGGMQTAVPMSVGVDQAKRRNLDVRHHPNWYFAERDWFSVVAEISAAAVPGDAGTIAVFNAAQVPFEKPDGTSAVSYIWGLQSWLGQPYGRGDGRDGGIDNRLKIHRQGHPNSRTIADSGDAKESVRGQVMLDVNREFFAGADPDPDPDPGDPDPGPDPGPGDPDPGPGDPDPEPEDGGGSQDGGARSRRARALPLRSRFGYYARL